MDLFAEEAHDNDDDGDLCRICRSPQGPENPLRYPCACRGSIKYVHQECLLLWLNRRRYKQCEVCKRSYSFVPVYAENAPERLSRPEFLKGLFVRVLRFFVWLNVILFNASCFTLHPWGHNVATEIQRAFRVNWMLASLLASFVYNYFLAYTMTTVTLLRLTVGRLIRIHRQVAGENDIGENDIPVGGRGVVVGVAIVLWKYMRILSDWWHDHLIRCRFFYALMLEPREDVVRFRNAQLQEFGAIRTFISLLDDNLFAVLAISTYISFFFILLPFCMGKLVFMLLLLFPSIEKPPTDSLGQETGEASFISSNSPVVVGRLAVGILIIAVALPYLVWILSARVWRNLSKVKDGFVLFIKLGIFPLVLGCWLDFCILPLFGTTISKTLEILSDYPFLITLHWLFGIIWLQLTFNSMELIQKIIQKRAFWFLLDVTDPNYKVTKLHLGQTLFALAFHGALMVIVVHLPIKTISLISPSFSPLYFWIYDERIIFGSMAAYVCLTKVEVFEWLAELIRPAIEPIVHKWVNTVSSWLHLNDFLLENHEGQNVRPLLLERLQILGEWLVVFSIAEGSVVSFNGSQSDTTFEEEDIEEDRFIILKIGLMLFLALLSLFLVSTVSMALPVLMGRAFFHSISFVMLRFGLKHDDLFGFWIGCYILRAIYICTYFIVNHIKMGRTDILLNFVLLWIRNAFLFSIWNSVIPALLGLLVDLMIIIPLRVPLNQSPVYFLLQDWLIGLALLHVWTFLTMFTPVKCFATVAWCEKLEIIRSVGINQLPSSWLFCHVVGSIAESLLRTLAFPSVVASLFPLLGCSGAVNSAVQRLIWPVVLAIIISAFVAKLIRDLFMYIHRLEYDDLYLVGNRVADFIEDH